MNDINLIQGDCFEELDEEYFQIANERIKESKEQLRLEVGHGQKGNN